MFASKELCSFFLSLALEEILCSGVRAVCFSVSNCSFSRFNESSMSAVFLFVLFLLSDLDLTENEHITAAGISVVLSRCTQIVALALCEAWALGSNSLERAFSSECGVPATLPSYVFTQRVRLALSVAYPRLPLYAHTAGALCICMFC